MNDELLNQDISEYLIHSGVPGMSWYKHKFGKWQPQAVYAAGMPNPDIGDNKSRRNSKSNQKPKSVGPRNIIGTTEQRIDSKDSTRKGIFNKISESISQQIDPINFVKKIKQNRAEQQADRERTDRFNKESTAKADKYLQEMNESGELEKHHELSEKFSPYLDQYYDNDTPFNKKARQLANEIAELESLHENKFVNKYASKELKKEIKDNLRRLDIKASYPEIYRNADLSDTELEYKSLVHCFRSELNALEEFRNSGFTFDGILSRL